MRHLIPLAAHILRALRDPEQTGSIVAIAEVVEREEVMTSLVGQLRESDGYRQLFAERPRIAGIDLPALAALPEGTLGQVFASQMLAAGLDAEMFLHDEDRGEVHYLRTRLRETHDILHAVTGLDTSPPGELALQAVYLAQLGRPLARVLIGLGLLQAIRDSAGFQSRVESVVRGWLIGRAARPLLAIRWTQQWARPLEQVRADAGIELASIECVMAGRP